MEQTDFWWSAKTEEAGKKTVSTTKIGSLNLGGSREEIPPNILENEDLLN